MSETREFISIIKLNTQDAKNKLVDLQKQMKVLEDRRAAAKKDGDAIGLKNINKEMKSLQAQMKVLIPKTKDISNTFKNMSTSSVKDLNFALRNIKREMEGLDRGTKEFKIFEAQAKRLRTELAKVKAEGAAQRSWLGSMADGFNRVQGMVLAFVASITGISLTIRKSVADFAAMDQEMTNVMKYTGQTKKEVEAMNETFIEMDTRTPREKLNQLAADAGRLGISSRKAVEEFVDGADKINVALGDDLGDDAVKNIGKLAMMFGEDKKKGLRGAMLATGSTVNELSQNSSAAGAYLVDFTARVAGVGKQAGLTQQQIMGFASVLDQNMQQDETSATALQGLITKMFQEPAKFAKIAGKNIKEFTTLLKTDANTALLTFFESMRSKGGFAQLAPMFEKMNMDGARATGVLSVMADKLDDIKVAQNLANEAYSQGTSVLKEYEVQMSSEQARLDMAKKAFKEMSIQLGKELLPIARYTISTSSMMAKLLLKIITFVKQHTTQLLVLAGGLTAVTVAYKAATISAYLWYVRENALYLLQKARIVLHKQTIASIAALRIAYFLLTGQMSKALIVIRSLRIAGIANPIGAIVASVLTLAAVTYKAISALKKYKERMKEISDEAKIQARHIKNLSEAKDKANKATEEERAKLDRLTRIANSNVYSYKQRLGAMVALEKIVPGYHRNLQNEAKLTKSNSKALKDYISNLQKAALAQALHEKMIELLRKKFELESSKRKHQFSAKAVQAEIDSNPQYYNKQETRMKISSRLGTVQTYTIPSEANEKKHKELKMWTDKVKEKNEEIKLLNGEIENITQYVENDNALRNFYSKLLGSETSYDNTVIPRSDSPSVIGDTGKDDTDQKITVQKKKEYEERIKIAKGAIDAEQALNVMARVNGEKTYSEYMDAQHDIAIKGYRNLMEINKAYGVDYGQLQDDIAKEELAKKEDHSKALLSEIERNKQKQLVIANSAYYDSNSDIFMDAEALAENIYDINLKAMLKKYAALERGSQEWFDTQAELEMMQEEHKVEMSQRYNERLMRYREEWGTKSNDVQEKLALKGLEDLHDKELLSEEEYQRMKMAMRLHFAAEGAKKEKEMSLAETQKTNAQKAYSAAADKADAEIGNKPNNTLSFFIGDISRYRVVNEELKRMYEDDKISYVEMQMAKKTALEDFTESIATKMQTAMNALQPIMSGMSSLYDAQSNYEQAVTTKKYDKMIAAAGNNSKKTQKLEEQKQKELAKIKTKYNKKAMRIEIAQALATTAIAALNAYASTIKIPIVGPTLAPIAAGIATAAGMLQVAAIKKQHAAEEAGYYDGGFTGGGNYRKKAGVVHEGEFVANHYAVGNRNILPALELIDKAQKNNTVGRLTAEDLSRSLGVGGGAIVSAPTVNVQVNNDEIMQTMQEARTVIERLTLTLNAGIRADVSIDGKNGVFKNLEKFNKLNSNK